MRHISIALLLTAALLAACGTPSAVSDGLVLSTAPIEYLAEVPEPALTGPQTNSSIAEYINALKDALRQANDGMAVFRWWWSENQ